MDFIKTAKEPDTFPGKAYFLIFSKNNILIKEESENLVSIPCITKKSVAHMQLNETCFLGKLKGIACYCAHMPPETVTDMYKFINLRALYGKIDNDFWSIAGYARQIHDWNINFKFCGKCGVETTRKKMNMQGCAPNVI
ncbi:MAG: hypothetical protein K8S13_15630 [Desulfobacula sp.]|uniref:NUDIX-like domain-containing protein n=1 Tax=Desulfobacula sp. TaxID=2593537 RepID=UPI0025C40AD9|nr:NUDIX-like domain-containing protein [Desulfobacula sp.]MCD4721271.1 hypothetical protein [Desulfobacula sp.]